MVEESGVGVRREIVGILEREVVVLEEKLLGMNSRSFELLFILDGKSYHFSYQMRSYFLTSYSLFVFLYFTRRKFRMLVFYERNRYYSH